MTEKTDFNQSSNIEEINLIHIFHSLVRHKILIAKSALVAVLFSSFYAFTQKPIWEGQFQIVLRNPNPESGRLNKLFSNNSILASLGGISGNKQSSLDTEVKILESPSVLKPIYEFVINKKREEGDVVESFRFNDWLSNLDVNLEDGTSVLTITYQDTNKELILPVIKRISKAYQTYSGRDRSRGLDQGLIYLEEQLSNLRMQANKSMRAAQSFALNNRLGLQDGMPTAITAGSAAGASGSVEVSREAAQNKVNSLQQQLFAVRSAGDTRVHVAPQFEANAELYSRLQDLEAQLQEKAALLRDNDPSIQKRKRQIRSLTQVINKQTIGLLEGQLQTALAQLNSLVRPRDVVLKHRELVRNALRDESTVNELENQLQQLRLEKARQTEPWELISTPTLLDNPVAPRKKRIVFLGLIAGIILGSGVSLALDRRSGILFSEEELRNLLPYPLLKSLSAVSQNTFRDAANLLALGPLSEVSGSTGIALIPLGDIAREQLQVFSREMRQALNGRELIVSSDLVETRKCSTQLLIVAPGNVTRKQLSQFIQELALQGSPVAGWLLLN